MLINNHIEREARRAENRRLAISFLASETWTTPRTLQMAMQCSKGAVYKVLSQLRRDGLVRDHKIDDLNLSIVGATPQCIAEAASLYGLDPTLTTLQPHKIRPVSVAHKLDLQQARIQAECAGWTGWILARDLPRRWAKYPDSLVVAPDGDRVAVELERTVKTRRRYESILSIHLQAVSKKQYSAVHYVCKNDVTANAITRIFRSISRIPVAGKRVTLHERHRARIPVFVLETWPPLT